MAPSEERSGSRCQRLAPPVALILRFSAYALGAALLAEAMVEGASRGWFAAIGAEGGPIEYAHYALCATAAVVFARASTRSSLPDVFALAAYGAALAVIREADAFLDHVAFHGAYKIPAAVLGAFGVTRAYRARTALFEQLSRWVLTPSFAITASGVFVVLVYAQIAGQKELWQSLMGSSYMRPVKDVAEEMQEMLGYLLIFVGAIESYVLACSTETVAAKPGLK